MRGLSPYGDLRQTEVFMGHACWATSPTQPQVQAWFPLMALLVFLGRALQQGMSLS